MGKTLPIWSNRKDLKQKFSAIQSENQKNELKAIAKKQEKSSFFEFLKFIKNKWFGKEKNVENKR